MEERVWVSGEEIDACKTFQNALILCFRLACKSLSEVAFDCNLPVNTLSRILRISAEGDDVRHMPGDALVPFMISCGNLVPLRWLMMRLGLSTPPLTPVLKGEALREMQDRLEELKESQLTKADLLEALRELQAPVRRPRAQKSVTRLSMRMCFIAPAWMRQQAADMEFATLKAA